MDTTHELDHLDTSRMPSYVGWHCRCGAAGGSTAAFAGDDVEEKALKNHAAHARRNGSGRCTASSWRGKTKQVFGPGGYNRCKFEAGDHTVHVDGWGNMFTISADGAFKKVGEVRPS